MAVPYSNSIAEALDGHLRIKHAGNWQYTEDVRVKQSGSWQDVKEVYVKVGGSWRLIHEGDHFLFNTTITGNTNTQFNLSTYITGLGYSGTKIKGAVTVNNIQQRLNLNAYSSDSKVYLRINQDKAILGAGGNGGTRGGQNGQNGQRALRSEGTPFILDNGGIIGGGGAGGGGGNNSNCVYQNTNYFSCQKGEQCSELVQNQSPAYGGGGGGGAGYPGGSGGSGGSQGYNGGNGNQNGGGSGGPNAGGASPSTQPGGDGGGLGENGANPTGGGSSGDAGAAIDGWSYRAGESGNGYQEQNIRGPKIN